jgi:hypothetical protein
MRAASGLTTRPDQVAVNGCTAAADRGVRGSMPRGLDAPGPGPVGTSGIDGKAPGWGGQDAGCEASVMSSDRPVSSFPQISEVASVEGRRAAASGRGDVSDSSRLRRTTAMRLDGEHAAKAGALRPASARPTIQTVRQDISGPAEVLRPGELGTPALGPTTYLIRVSAPGPGQ